MAKLGIFLFLLLLLPLAFTTKPIGEFSLSSFRTLLQNFFFSYLCNPLLYFFINTVGGFTRDTWKRQTDYFLLSHKDPCISLCFSYPNKQNVPHSLSTGLSIEHRWPFNLISFFGSSFFSFFELSKNLAFSVFYHFSKINHRLDHGNSFWISQATF